MRIGWVQLGLLTISIAASSATCAAPMYSIVDLGTLGGSRSSIPSLEGNINSNGQITGYSYILGDASYHAFLYTSGIGMTDLGTLGGRFSEGYGVNDMGQVTGYSKIPSTFDRAFLYNGAMNALSPLSNTESGGYSINDKGQTTGFFDTSTQGDPHAFFYDGSSFRDLGTLGGSQSFGTGINEAGKIVGYSNNTGDRTFDAFLYDGSLHDLGTLGGDESMAWSVNNKDQVTGNARTAADLAHAFLYDGTMRDLGTLGGTESFGYGINDNGWVVGESYLPENTVRHAFLYDGISMHDINDLITPADPLFDKVTFIYTGGINDRGEIAAEGCDARGTCTAYRLDPVIPAPEPSAVLVIVTALVGWRRPSSHRSRRCACGLEGVIAKLAAAPHRMVID